MLSYSELTKSNQYNKIYNTVQNLVSEIQEKKYLNAFITLNTEAALMKAKESDFRFSNGTPRKLEGMIVGVKDNISTKNLKTSAASKMLENYIPIFSATVIERLEAAGAIIIGKTNLDEFGMGCSSEYSHFGQVKNPINESFVAGGSSGGSAVAVKSELCHIALGSDTGGSVRLPSSFCGVYGFKPSYGRISRYGLIALASSMDTIGIISNNLEDLELLFDGISGEDEFDSTSYSDDEISKFDDGKEIDLSKNKIGILGPDLLKFCDDDVRTVYLEFISKITKAGLKTKEVKFECFDLWIPAYQVIMTAEASSNLARYDGLKYGYRSKSNSEDIVTASRTEGFGEEVKRRILLGNYVLSKGYYDKFYSKAQKVRRLIANNYKLIFEETPLVLMPVAPTPAFKVGEKQNDVLNRYETDFFNVSANLAGIPSLSFPAGLSSNNLPIGLQVQTKFMEDKKLIKSLKALLSII